MDVVVDVGGVYDPEHHRYDHHQPTFNDTFSPEHKTLLSSAGLVYKHFVKEIIAAKVEGRVSECQDAVNLLYRKIYDSFVEPFDAHDNGISPYASDLKPRFARSWDIFAQVNALNPEWNETGVDADARFKEAVQLVRNNFETVLGRYIRSWLPGRALVQESLLKALHRPEDDPIDRRIMVLKDYCPYSDHLFALEEELKASTKHEDAQILYVIYRDSTGRGWRIQAVPKAPDSFECRKALPSEWRGLRDKELDEVTGLEGCIFVHRAGFIGGHSTEEGAIKMAELSLK